MPYSEILVDQDKFYNTTLFALPVKIQLPKSLSVGETYDLANYLAKTSSELMEELFKFRNKAEISGVSNHMDSCIDFDEDGATSRPPPSPSPRCTPSPCINFDEEDAAHQPPPPPSPRHTPSPPLGINGDGTAPQPPPSPRSTTPLVGNGEEGTSSPTGKQDEGIDSEEAIAPARRGRGRPKKKSAPGTQKTKALGGLVKGVEEVDTDGSKDGPQ